MKIELINLDRSEERLARFRHVNSHLRNIERFSAVDGKAIDRSALVRDGYIHENLDFTPGALGCAMSHVYLWERSLKKNKIVTVAEDDAIFSLYFENKANTLINGLRCDWDIILWGFEPRCFLWVEFSPASAAAEIRWQNGLTTLDRLSFQASPATVNLYKLLHNFGTVCYTISPKGARSLLNLCLPFGPKIVEFSGFNIRTKNEGIDVAMCDVYPKINAYVSLGPLVLPDLVSSDNSEIGAR